MENMLWPIVLVAIRRVVPLLVGAGLMLLAQAGLLAGPAADACRQALGL